MLLIFKLQIFTLGKHITARSRFIPTSEKKLENGFKCSLLVLLLNWNLIANLTHSVWVLYKICSHSEHPSEVSDFDECAFNTKLTSCILARACQKSFKDPLHATRNQTQKSTQNSPPCYHFHFATVL